MLIPLSGPMLATPPLPSFAVLDTETTGLQKDPDAHVVELGVARFENGVCVARRSWIVRPPVLTEAGLEVAWRISHISESEILAAPSPLDIWAEAQPLLSGLPVVAWNLPFDQTMVRRTFFPSETLEVLIARQLYPPAWQECAMRRYSKRFAAQLGAWPSGEPKWAKLTKAALQCGLSWTGTAHRADADAEMTGQLYLGLLRDTLTFTPIPEPEPAPEEGTGSTLEATP